MHRDAESKKPSPPSAFLGLSQAPTVLLGTALNHARDVVGSPNPVRALLDSASQISAITYDCCIRLGLQPTRWTLPVTGLGSQKIPDIQGIVQLDIQPQNSSIPSICVKAWVLPSITTDMPVRQLPGQVCAKCSHLVLADLLLWLHLSSQKMASVRKCSAPI